MKHVPLRISQIVTMLRESDRAALDEVAKKCGFSAGLLVNLRRRFGGVVGVDVSRMDELRQENARLRRLLNQREFDAKVKQILTKPR